MALKDLLNADIQNYYLNYPFQNEFNYGAGTKVSGGIFDQKSQKFGQGRASDQPKGGFSNQPYIQTPIPEGDDNYNFLPIGGSQVLNIIDTVTDGLIRGGLVTATAHSVVDVVRLSKFGIDVLRGPAFIAKQIGLQRSNVKVGAPQDRPRFDSNRLYNLGINTLAQAGVNAFGLHFKRHGAYPQQSKGEEDPTGYASIMKGSFLEGGNNRLLSFKEDLNLGNPDRFYLENSFNKQTQKQLYDYSGGPGSVYGIGRTKIFSYTNTNPILPPPPPIIPLFSSYGTPSSPIFPGYGIPKYISDSKSTSLLYRKDPFPFGELNDGQDANHKIYFPITGFWGDRENNLSAGDVANPLTESYTTQTGVVYLKGAENSIPTKLQVIYDAEGNTTTGRPLHTPKSGKFYDTNADKRIKNRTNPQTNLKDEGAYVYPTINQYNKTLLTQASSGKWTIYPQVSENSLSLSDTDPIAITYTTKLDPDKLKITYDDEGYTDTGRPSHTVKIGNFSPDGEGSERTNYPSSFLYSERITKEISSTNNTVGFQEYIPNNIFNTSGYDPTSITYTTKLDPDKLKLHEVGVGKPSHIITDGNFSGITTEFTGILKQLPITNYVDSYPFDKERLGDSLEVYKPILEKVTETFTTTGDRNFTEPTYTTLLNYSKTDGGLNSPMSEQSKPTHANAFSNSPYYGGTNPLQRIGGDNFNNYTRASERFNLLSSDPDKEYTIYTNSNLNFTSPTYTTLYKDSIILSDYDGSLKPLKVKSNARMFSNRLSTNRPKTKLLSIKNIDIARKEEQWAKSETALAEGAYDVKIYNYLSLDNPVLNSERSPVSPTISVDPLKNLKQPVGLVGQKLALGELKDFRAIKGNNDSGELGKYYQQMSSNYGTSNMESRLKIGTGFDAMNRLPIIRHLVGDKPDSKSGKGTRDLIKFFIETVDNDDPGVSDTLFFRAYLTSFNDNYGAKWDSYNFVGNPEKFYNYNSFDRDISLSFIISANSKEELRPMYVKLNALISNLMPDYQKWNTRIRAPYVKLNVGSYLNRMPGFIESLGVQWDTNYPWEIGINKPNGTITKDLQVLPHVLKIDLKFKPIHNFVPRKMTICDPDVPFITLNTRVGDAPGGAEQYFIGDGKESGVIKEGTHLFGGKGTGNYTISGDAPGCITPPKPDPLPVEREDPPVVVEPEPLIIEDKGETALSDSRQIQQKEQELKNDKKGEESMVKVKEQETIIADEESKGADADQTVIEEAEKEKLNIITDPSIYDSQNYSGPDGSLTEIDNTNIQKQIFIRQ